jgi:FkbM family methyltransferase
MVEVKHLIKMMIPRRMIPVAQRFYWSLISNLSKTKFSKDEYEDISALKCTVSYNKYGGYCVPESSRHRPVAQKILSKDVHEPKTIEYIASNCGTGDIVHAGTYFGDFLPALSKSCSQSSKVWAFEPNSENYRCAKITLEINNIANVVLTNAGLGAKQEKLLMKTADENGRALGGKSQIIDKQSGELNRLETIQMVTVDDTVGSDRAISIIQLDVEGYEKEALTGALKTIQRCLPIIIIEVRSKSTLPGSDWFYENILNLGYRKINDIHCNSVYKYGSQD